MLQIIYMLVTFNLTHLAIPRKTKETLSTNYVNFLAKSKVVTSSKL